MKIRIFILILFSLIFSINICLADDWTQAQALLDEGQFSEALNSFNTMWAKDPSQTGLNPYIDICKKMIKAQDLFEKTNYTEALELTEQVAQVIPNNEKVRTLLIQGRKAVGLLETVNENYKTGDHEKVLQSYTELLDLNPKDDRTARAVNAYRQFSMQLDKARSLFRQGAFAESLTILRKAWVLLPTDPVVQQDISINMKALTLQDLFIEGDYDAAAVGFRELFNRYPQFDILRINVDKALQAKRLAIDMRVDFAEEKYNDAITVATLLVKLNPEDAEAEEVLNDSRYVLAALDKGKSFLTKQDYKAARDLYAEAIKAVPSAQMLKERKDITNVIVIEQDASNENLSNNKLKRYITFEELKKYVLVYVRLQRPEKDSSELIKRQVALRNEGLKLFFKADYRNAISKLEEALKIDAQDKQARDYRERAKTAQVLRAQIKNQHKAQEYTEAQNLYQKLLEVNPQEKSYSEIIAE